MAYIEKWLVNDKQDNYKVNKYILTNDKWKTIKENSPNFHENFSNL